MEIPKENSETNFDKFRNCPTFDGREPSEGEVIIPFLANKDYMKELNPNYLINLVTWHFGSIPFLIGFDSHKKEAYGAYMKEFWSEINKELKEKRPGRCIVGHKANGYPILCSKTNKCEGCPKRGTLERYRPDTNRCLSLEYAFEGEGFDISDPSQKNPEDIVIMNEKKEFLMNALKNEENGENEKKKKKKKRCAEIIGYTSKGLNKKEIISKMGLHESQGYNVIREAYKETRRILESYDNPEPTE